VSSAQHLEKMANDIGDFFKGQPVREDAIAGIANHLRSFWTPQMRRKMIAQIRHGDARLDELPREAFRRLMDARDLKPQQSPGGDAG
jgi:formate dehydrogenase subunit delta